VGYFAPSSRFGTPDDLRALVDALHGVGVGVILDWVPSHFPSDAHALAVFDGTHLYEHADERQRVHPDWLSWTFNYSRNEVRSFLTSSASYWIEQFHADGLRVDAVASMLYLDYSRRPGEWVPNREGGREDLDAIDLLRYLNDHLHGAYPGVVTIAEESTAWAGVTAPSREGGLGFDFKWDMGWMHDTLTYLGRDPIHRRYHHHEVTFRALYAHHERFVMALSHDEMVHGKGSLFTKMAGDDWQRFASLRLLYGYQYGLPGKKLLFMGSEFAQIREWDHERSLDWHLLADPRHEGVRRWVQALNEIYRGERSWWGDDASEMDFGWVSCDDVDQSILAWRRGVGERATYVVANFTPVPRENYVIHFPGEGEMVVLAHSDQAIYGGSGYPASAEAPNLGSEVRLRLPPLGVMVLTRKVS
jgi:1,4-alpha-glucan branching enzyme